MQEEKDSVVQTYRLKLVKNSYLSKSHSYTVTLTVSLSLSLTTTTNKFFFKSKKPYLWAPDGDIIVILITELKEKEKKTDE